MNRFTGSAIAIVLALAAGFSTQAQASIYVEPYLGYFIGKMDRGTTKYDVHGFNYGGRLGYSALGLAGGLEYQTGMLKDNATPNNDITPTDIGLFVSYKLPMLLRVYAGYFFSSEAKVGTNNTYKGSGMKFGIGFTTLPFVILNLDYMTNTYDKDSNGAVSPKIESTGFLFNVSIPFEF